MNRLTFAATLMLVAVALVSCRPQPATTPDEWSCRDNEQRPVRKVQGDIDYIAAHYCDADVCGGASWVCGSTSEQP